MTDDVEFFIDGGWNYALIAQSLSPWSSASSRRQPSASIPKLRFADSRLARRRPLAWHAGVLTN